MGPRLPGSRNYDLSWKPWIDQNFEPILRRNSVWLFASYAGFILGVCGFAWVRALSR
jgi:hypothetical protein